MRRKGKRKRQGRSRGVCLRQVERKEKNKKWREEY